MNKKVLKGGIIKIKITRVFLIALLVVFLDQLSKILIRNNFELNQSVPIIKGILSFTYTTNTGSAFGLLKGYNTFFILFSITVIIAILYIIRKIGHVNMKHVNERFQLSHFSLSMLLGGTLGNLIDRFIYGSVIDFIDFRIWPVFNLADSAITISAVLLFLLLLRIKS